MSCQLPTAHLSNSKIPEEKPTHLKFYSFEVICKFENMSTLVEVLSTVRVSDTQKIETMCDIYLDFM